MGRYSCLLPSGSSVGLYFCVLKTRGGIQYFGPECDEPIKKWDSAKNFSFLSDISHLKDISRFKNQSNSKPRRTWIGMRENGIKITTIIDQSIIFWMKRYVKTWDCKSVFSILFVLLLIGKYWNPIEISKSSQLANFWNRCRLINTILIC